MPDGHNIAPSQEEVAGPSPTPVGDGRAWTFNRRLVLAYGAFSLVTLLGAGLFTWWQAETIGDRNRDLAVTETRRVADRVGAMLEQARQGIAVLAVLDPMAREPDACGSLLNTVQITMDAAVRTILVLGPDMRVLCATIPSLVGNTAPRAGAHTAALTGRPVIGTLVNTSVGHMIGVAQPLRRQGRHDHVLVAALSLDAMREVFITHPPEVADLQAWLLDSAEASLPLIGPAGAAPPPIPDALRISFAAPRPEDAGLATDDGRFLVQARVTPELTLLASFPRDAIRAAAPMAIALPPLVLALMLLAGLGVVFRSVQRSILDPLEAATRRLEAPGAALPPREGDDQGSAEVAALVRRLGASRSTQEEAIRLRDLLLQEAHHRIKNHLTLVASFLRLQERQLSDHAALKALRAAQGRILAIGLTYALLQGSTGESVALHALLERFAAALTTRDGTEGAAAAEIVTDLAPLDVPADVAVKTVLVVNELATNALKHAFTGRGPGKIRITLRPAEGGGYLLRVADDGNGMPAEPRRGLGLTVTDNLLRGIGATVLREQGPGTTFAITWRPRAPG